MVQSLSKNRARRRPQSPRASTGDLAGRTTQRLVAMGPGTPDPNRIGRRPAIRYQRQTAGRSRMATNHHPAPRTCLQPSQRGPTKKAQSRSLIIAPVPFFCCPVFSFVSAQFCETFPILFSVFGVRDRPNSRRLRIPNSGLTMIAKIKDEAGSGTLGESSNTVPYGTFAAPRVVPYRLPAESKMMPACGLAPFVPSNVEES